jgi:endonuclease/exonuclease/phosphatase (EEP) superfamily protein YafD
MLGSVGVLVATAVVPAFPVNWWWVRIGDFPRMQLLVAYLMAAAVLVAFFRQRRGVFVAVSLLMACVGLQLFWVYSYLPIASRQVEGAKQISAKSTIKIMASNVLQSNEQAEALLQLIDHQQPDLLVLCEVNERWISDLASLEDAFAHHKIHPQENKYGIALYSQLPMLRAEVRTMVSDEIPSIDATLQLRNGRSVRVFAVHPNPPRIGEDTTKRDAELVLVGREIRDEPSALVLGDLNDVGWSRTSDLFREVSGLLDPRIGRGFYATFDATSWILRYPLDYVFHSDDFRVVELEVLPTIGSDHFPLWLVLNHDPGAEDTQSATELDKGDREDAQEAIDAADQDDSTEAIDR